MAKATGGQAPHIHVVIPDTQVAPGVPIDNLRWIGQYIVDQCHDKPNVRIIHLGDHADMPSLSSYDKKGSRKMEGKRYVADIKAANDGFDLLCAPLDELNLRRKKNKEKQWWPERHILLGNHEHRITRAIEDEPKLDGILSLDHLNYRTHGWKVHDFLNIAWLDGVAYCLSPDHSVLMRDLSYRPLGDLVAGDELVGFDEHGEPGLPRRYRTSTVLAATPASAPLFRVHLESGKTFDTTADHRWLARRRGRSAWRWMHTHELLPIHEICKPFPTWNSKSSWDAGWLAGIFDGEGWISKPNSQQGGIQVGFAQNPGGVLDRALSTLGDMGIAHTVYKSGPACINVRIGGTSGEKLALLGSINATRLIENFQPEMLGRVQQGAGAPDGVAHVESVGTGDIVQLQTSTNTFIADGYAHHNCHYFYQPNTGRPFSGMAETRLKSIGHSFVQGHQQGLQIAQRSVAGNRHRAVIAGSAYLHNEDYRGPQATDEWRGILILHQVIGGNFDLMEVSLDYLARRYEGKPLARFMGRAA